VSDEPKTTFRGLAGRTYGMIGAAGRRLLRARPAAANGAAPHGADGVSCNICLWQGEAFADGGDVGRSTCPSCGSDGQERFARWCLTERVDLHPELRVLEPGYMFLAWHGRVPA
jgi:hypothetical protein